MWHHLEPILASCLRSLSAVGAVVAVFLWSGAAANEPGLVRAVAPSDPRTDSMEFISQYSGATVRITEPLSDGSRAVQLVGCGEDAGADLVQRIPSYGRLLLVYELGDVPSEKCLVDISIFYADKPFGWHKFKVSSIGLLFGTGEFSLLDQNRR